MFVVGLTGGIGSGKSEASRMFQALGVPVTDVDAISHQLTSVGHPILSEIISTFGLQFQLADGQLNRPLMREEIFNNSSSKERLERILHPAIFDEALKTLEKNKQSPYQILAIPLLFESNRYRNVVNRSLVIDCPEAMQIQRVMHRSNLSEEAVKSIMHQQIRRDERLRLADDVIINDGDLALLNAKISEYHKKMLMYLHS